MKIVLPQDVIEGIKNISAEMYPGKNLGPTISQYNAYKTGLMPRAETLMDRFFGKGDRTVANWRKILAAAGLRHPVRKESIYATQRMQEIANMDLAENCYIRISDIHNAKLVDAGMAATVRHRPVRKWCIRRHTWVDVYRTETVTDPATGQQIVRRGQLYHRSYELK